MRFGASDYLPIEEECFDAERTIPARDSMIEATHVFDLKRLLVATDLSPRADAALRRAARLAGDHGAEIVLLHVCEADGRDDQRARQLARDGEEKLRRKVRALSMRGNGAATVRVTTGKPFVEIIRVAREENAELVIVGAHGGGFLKTLLLGTTAERVVRKGDRPVLVVKRASQTPYRQVLVPVDFSEASRVALQLALQFAPHAKFHVLHAYEGIEGRLWRADFTHGQVMSYRSDLRNEKREEMRAFLRGIDCGAKSIRQLLRHGRAPHAITAAARQLHADLVCVGTAGRAGLPYILLGSVAEHVLREVPCDVLAARSGPSSFQLP
jgi:nucleotide-binding universal stress UspA family protein